MRHLEHGCLYLQSQHYCPQHTFHVHHNKLLDELMEALLHCDLIGTARRRMWQGFDDTRANHGSMLKDRTSSVIRHHGLMRSHAQHHDLQNIVAAIYTTIRRCPAQRRTLLAFHQSCIPTLSPILYFFARALPSQHCATHTYLIFTIRSPLSISLDPLPSKNTFPILSRLCRLPDRQKRSTWPMTAHATNYMSIKFCLCLLAQGLFLPSLTDTLSFSLHV